MVHATLKRQTPADTKIHYSVIIPAYNEEMLLPNTLQNLKAAMNTVSQYGEIVVVDNNSTDKTAEIAKTLDCKVIFEPYRQIARARNSGARAAQGEFLIFLDADTTLPIPLLMEALRLLEGGNICGGGSLISFDAKLPYLAGKLVRFWNWLSATKKLAAGSFIFCLARGFAGTGGFDEKAFAGEEIILSRRLKNWGRKHKLQFIILKDNPVITSSRKFYWYSSMQISLLLLLFTIFPFALRSRTLCRFWYDRPSKS